MNWYKKAQEEPKLRPPKGWKITVKKDKRTGLYGASVWDKRDPSPLPIDVPVLFDYPSRARDGAIKWLEHQLSGKNF